MFPVNFELSQGRLMSLWLFNVYMDGVVREVNVRVAWEMAGVAEYEWWQV